MVRVMFIAILGILLGVAVCAGPLIAYNAEITGFVDRIAVAAADVATRLIDKIPGAADNPKVVTLFATLIAVCAPGLLAIALTWSAQAVISARRFIGAMIMLAAIASFFVLPAPQALGLVVGALVINVMLLIPVAALSRIVLWCLATVLAFGHVRGLWTGTDPVIGEGVAALSSLSDMNTPELWKFALISVALAPFVAAFWAIFRPTPLAR